MNNRMNARHSTTGEGIGNSACFSPDSESNLGTFTVEDGWTIHRAPPGPTATPSSLSVAPSALHRGATGCCRNSCVHMAERPAKQPRLQQAGAAGVQCSRQAERERGREKPAAQQQLCTAIAGREQAQLQRVGRPAGWLEQLAAGGGRRYVPVGAIVCDPRLVQPIRKALEAMDWMKKTSQRIHACHCGDGRRKRVAIHVCPVAAATLDAAAAQAARTPEAAGVNAWEAELPVELAACAQLLYRGEAVWRSGLRIGDRIEDGGLGPQWHLIPADVKMQQLRQGRRPTVEIRRSDGCSEHAPAAFRFIELFAGIGGFRVALESLGGECIFSSEIGVEERLTYFVNFGSFPAGDITETPTSAVPVAAAGSGARGLVQSHGRNITAAGAEDGSNKIGTGGTESDAVAYELLTAGFPCQSFCKAGLKTGPSQQQRIVVALCVVS